MDTTGIGEHQATIRQAICARTRFAGLDLDAQANAVNALQISAKQSAVPLFVVPTDEEAMIAIHTLRGAAHFREPGMTRSSPFSAA